MTHMSNDDEMRLDNWLKSRFTRIQLTPTTIVNGMTITNELNRDLTIGLLSTSNKDEWRDLCFHYAPVGTIKTDIDEEYYNGKILLLRNELTIRLMDERQRTLVDKYLKILERRDREHWSEQSKQTTITAKSNDNILNITFT